MTISKSALTILILIAFANQIMGEKLVMVGGGLKDNNQDVYTAFINLAATSGDKQPHIGIVTAASQTPDDNGKFYVDLFQNTYGVADVTWIPIDMNQTENAFNLDIVNQVIQMNGIFFGGGDQLRLVQCFTTKGKDTPVLAAIRQNFQSNFTTIGGTSAGTMAQTGSPMITGGESYQALRYGPFPSIDPKNPDNLSYYPGGGFGLFSYGYLDTHFAVRGRQGRMIAMIYFLINNGIRRGVGVDENTALVIVDGNGQIAGGSGAYFFEYNGTQAENIVSGGGNLQINNVTTIYLTPGDAINMKTLQVTYAPYKQNIQGNQKYDYPMSASHDIFSSDSDRSGRVHPGEFTYVTTDLFDSAKSNNTYATTYETAPEFKVSFYQTPGSSAYYGTYNFTEFISYNQLSTTIQQQLLISEQLKFRETEFLAQQHEREQIQRFEQQ